MRKTVHLIPTEDAGWLLPLFSPTDRALVAQAAGRLRPRPRAARTARWRFCTRDRRHGPLTRPELAERLAAAGFDDGQEIKVHLWLLATLDGELCLGPDRGGQTCLVRTGDWIGEPSRRPRDESLAELARRYIRAYGPADERDFARWAGLPLRDAGSGSSGSPASWRGPGRRQTLLVTRRRGRRRASAPVVRMLGAFDNYNLGYVSRGFAVAADGERQIVPGRRRSCGRRSPSTAASSAPGRRSAPASGSRSRSSPSRELEPEIEAAIAAEVEDIGKVRGPQRDGELAARSPVAPKERRRIASAS